jgi:hypothetical protein
VHGQAEAKQGDARLAAFVRLGAHD